MKKAFIIFTLFLVVFLKSSRQAHAASFYVSRNGDNSTGTTWSNAWNELSQIKWSLIGPGDIIYIDGGTESMSYVTPLIPAASGTSTSPVRIMASTETNHSGTVIINGGRKTPLPECGQASYSPYTSSSQVFQNEAGIYLQNVNNIIIDGRRWNGIQITRNSYGMRFRPNTIHALEY